MLLLIDCKYQIFLCKMIIFMYNNTNRQSGNKQLIFWLFIIYTDCWKNLKELYIFLLLKVILHLNSEIKLLTTYSTRKWSKMRFNMIPNVHPQRMPAKILMISGFELLKLINVLSLNSRITKFKLKEPLTANKLLNLTHHLKKNSKRFPPR